MLLPASQHVSASAFTWPAALFLWGPPGSWSDRHRRHCVQLVMALKGTLRFRQHAQQGWTRCDAVLVRADAWHEVNARGAAVLLAFVDAESELGAALTERTASDVAPIPVRRVREWRAQLGDAESLTAVQVGPWVNDGEWANACGQAHASALDWISKETIETSPRNRSCSATVCNSSTLRAVVGPRFR